MLQAYAGVLKNSGFDRDAAYNYEYVARLRDAGRAREAGTTKSPSGDRARQAGSARRRRPAICLPGRRFTAVPARIHPRRAARSSRCSRRWTTATARRSPSRRQASSCRRRDERSLTFGAPRYLPLLIVPAVLMAVWLWRLAARRRDLRRLRQRRIVPRPRALRRVRRTAVLGGAARRCRAPHRGGRPATGTLVHPAPGRPRSRGPAGRVGVDARQ